MVIDNNLPTSSYDGVSPVEQDFGFLKLTNSLLRCVTFPLNVFVHFGDTIYGIVFGEDVRKTTNLKCFCFSNCHLVSLNIEYWGK